MNALFRSGQLEHLEPVARRMVERYPDYPYGWNMIGLVLDSRGQLRQALSAASRAAALAPNDARLHWNLGYLLKALGVLDAAEASYRRALELEPERAAFHIELGKLLADRGRMAEAEAAFRRALELEPDNAVARHHYAACSGAELPERASDDYIRQMFDEFSGSFDRVLGSLEYGGPQQTASALAALFPAPKGDLHVLDVGCGTGLCGPVARPYAARLTGVDLSAGMLAKARERGVYDALAEAEVVDYMARHPTSFDLIVCADTLMYFGELAPFFGAAAKALKPGGHLVVTMEKLDGGSDARFRLHHHGRYAHTEPYMEGALAAAGFAIRAVEPVMVRKELGEPVPGMLVTASVGARLDLPARRRAEAPGGAGCSAPPRRW
jgi:predicted TPR repeat methyltransferase